MDQAKLTRFVDRLWDDEILPQLVEYIRIPNKSPAFDPDWAKHGHMDRAVALMESWARGKIAGLPGATLEVLRLVRSAARREGPGLLGSCRVMPTGLPRPRAATSLKATPRGWPRG